MLSKQRPKAENNVVNQIRHVLERFDQRLSLNDPRLAERYIKSEIHVLVDFMLDGIDEQLVA